ncbi:putative cytochrome P450 CYP13A8 [Aphelenchoides bicaudatus]|nr:putative cytochrome P450 CYP13A8 [Aphelenchoides bicaudatus]
MAIFMLLAVFLVGVVRQVSELNILYIKSCSYAVYNTKYWSRRGIDGPPSLPFFGHLFQLYDPLNPASFKLHEYSKVYGKVYGVQRGLRNALVVSDAKLAHEIFNERFESFHQRDRPPIIRNIDTDPNIHLLTAAGKRWKRLRALSAPAFSTGNLRKVLPIMEDCAQQTIGWLEKAFKTNKEFDISRYFEEFSLDIIRRVALGQVGSHQFTDNMAFDLKQTFADSQSWLMLYSWVFPSLGPFIRKVTVQLLHLRSYLTNNGLIRVVNSCSKAINDRKQKQYSKEQSDFIDLFLSMEVEQLDQEETTVYEKSKASVVKRLTSLEVLMQCIFFLLAGFDTTANSLTIVAYYLAKKPELQQKIVAEIEEVCCGEVGTLNLNMRSPTFEELAQLKYTEAFIRECLRFHPIAQPVVARRCVAPCRLSNDLLVEKDVDILLDVLSLHVDKEVWGDQADEFWPERFLEERPPVMYSFGSGPRTCIGMRFSILEQKAIIFHLLKKFKLVATEAMGEKICLTGNAVMTAENAIIRLEKRH